MARHRLKLKDNASSGVPVLALGAIALAAGVHHQSAGALALGAVLLAAPLLVFLYLRRVTALLAVRRSAPQQVFEGDRVEVRLEVHNRSRWPVFFPRLSEVFGPEIHEQKDVVFPDRLRPGESVEQGYSGDCLLPRGFYTIGPTTLCVSDPFGWFQLRRRLANEVTVTVYPPVFSFGIREHLGESVNLLVNRLTHRGRGESTEFFSVREYRAGDALRKVHWPLSARRGYPAVPELIVREFSRTSGGNLAVFIDSSRQALVGVGRGSSLELSVRIAGTLAARALRRGYRVQLVAGEAAELQVPAGRGQLQFRRILEALVRVKPVGTKSLPAVLAAHSRTLRRGSSVLVMVSPYLFEDEALHGQLRAWRGQGLRVVAVVFDARTFTRIWGSFETLADLDREDTQRSAARLRAAGVEVYVVPQAANLEALFRIEARG
jgi:uncharacterized protein (DUF58 family)